MGCPTLLVQSFIWMSLMAAGVQYEVTHIISKMCVVVQSTALIPCRYTGKRISLGQWFYNDSSGQQVEVSRAPAFEGRVEFSLSEEGNCSLILRDVRDTDAGVFHFVFTASGRNWTNAQGIRLEVTDAEVEVDTQSDVVVEGDGILFTCGSCVPSMTVPTYSWFKDGHLHRKIHADRLFYLDSVEPEDGGRYLCIISGHESLNSTHVNITVRPGYPPRNVSVSISGSSEVLEGDSVRLICSSDSNPPALTFSWFQENHTSAVGSGQSFSISSFNSSLSGRFYCEAHNKYGSQRSHAVSLSVKESSPSWIILTVGVSVSAVVTSLSIMVFIWLIRRKRVTQSKEEKRRGSQHKAVESENTYMTLDPTSRHSEYDTLDNIKKSCEETDDPED